MQNLTITGPRSVGKTTISKQVAKKLKLKYLSSDKIGDKAFKKQGGLDKATKSGEVRELIKDEGYSLINAVYISQKNYVFDLSGGAFTYRRIPEISLKVRKLAKEKSFIIGLLPSRNVISSIIFLFKREKEREHFKQMNKVILLKKVIKSYIKFPRIFKEWADVIIYTKGKSVDEITKEIITYTNGFK